MLQHIDPAARRLAFAGLLAGAMLAAPLHMATAAAPEQLAQASTAPATPAEPSQSQPQAKPKSRHSHSPTERVEARIKSLHERLKITPAQETQWNAFAQVMRDNAQHMQSLIEKRRQNSGTMNAVDDLRSYQEVADAHAQGLEKLIPAFQALYDTMSPEQKKNADAVFHQNRRHRHHTASSSKNSSK